MQLIDNEHWNVNLGGHDQTLLGRSYIALKRHASELDELTDEEEQAFIVVRNRLIGAIRTAFQPITFNLSCLKNDAFKPDPDGTPSDAAHVHWHVMPRYGTQPRVFAGHEFTDPRPGRYFLPAEPKRPPEGVALQIANAIRTAL